MCSLTRAKRQGLQIQPVLLPIRAGFLVTWSAWQKRYRSSVSSDTLPLSHFKLDVRGPLVWHIWQLDLELTQNYDNLSSSIAVLRIG
jgi:hypothetical protein